MEDKDRVEIFLKALINFCCQPEDDAWQLRLFADKRAKPADHPHLDRGQRPVVLQVGPGGGLDLADLIEAFTHGGLDHQVCAYLLQGVQITNLFDFLKFLATHHIRFEFLWKQVLFKLAERIDQQLQLSPDFIKPILTGTGKWFLHKKLAAYVEACSRMTEGIQHCSLAVDKSRVSGKGLMDTALVLSTNEACWLVPQAMALL